jgi:4-hydroxythreonine-4-phosphate dehydrogenase
MSTSRAEINTPQSRPRIVITSGEPAGIGPELCAQVAQGFSKDVGGNVELTCLVDRSLFEERSRAIGIEPAKLPMTIEHRPLSVPARAGELDVRNAAYVVGLLDAALDGIRAGRFDAMVTAPVQKSVIAESGVPFSGHTEYLAERTGTLLPIMMLVADSLRVALATTHLPLRRVPDAITRRKIVDILKVMHADLQRLWRIERPRIAVCGLNPHAGENGLLGDEEIKTIAPAIEEAKGLGVDAYGPIPADTAFVPREMAQYDAILAMYHDQGLPVLKHAGFGAAVNVTLGLPIIRTSVDHGTALSLAGTGRADSGSLTAALQLAVQLVERR